VGTWLGVAVVCGVAAAMLGTAVVLWAFDTHTGAAPRLVLVGLGCLGVGAAGLYDDLQPARTRGMLRQVRLLASGRVTSGVVKLVAITAVSTAVVWGLDVRGWRFVLAIPVVAGCANLWNLLDVVPARSLKAFLPAAAILGFAADGLVFDVLAIASAIAAALALPFDLREQGMLGDAGANVLGFVVGMETVGALTAGGLAAALAVLVILHVASETVSLSRLIRAVRPLRWYDDLGRRGDQGLPAERSTST
jgi:hypothetical protein